MTNGMIWAVLVLAGWSGIMLIWLYALRIPAMIKGKINPQKLADRGEKLALPPQISRPADNYTHLHEQPTVFYALALAAHAIGLDDYLSVALAFAYVGVRIAHSLVHATANIVLFRFSLFMIGSLLLAALGARILMRLLGLG